MDFDWTQITAGIATAAGTVWAAYQNFEDQPAWKKGLMVFGPLLLFSIFIIVSGS